MRFIVDESTGTAVVKYRRNVGYDVLAVAETMPTSRRNHRQSSRANRSRKSAKAKSSIRTCLKDGNKLCTKCSIRSESNSKV